MKLPSFRRKKPMSNSYVEIAKRMDDLIEQITATDIETKNFADQAVASHAKRLGLETELKQTEAQLRAAPTAIVDFLKALTVLPALVTEADSILDAENAAAEAEAAAAAEAELAAAEAADPVNPDADVIAVVSNPTPPKEVVEQPVSVPAEDPLVAAAGTMGVIGAETLANTPAPATEEPAQEEDPATETTTDGDLLATEPAPEPAPAEPAPADSASTPPAAEEAPVLDPVVATGTVSPAPGTGILPEATPVDEPAAEDTAEATPAETAPEASGDIELVESEVEGIAAEEEAPKINPLTGLPEAQV